MKERIRFAVSGEASLLVATLPASFSALESDVDTYVLPLEGRPGGLLVAFPKDVLSFQTLQDGSNAGVDALFGPNSSFTVPLFEEGEDLTMAPVGVDGEVVVVDASDTLLSMCRE